MRVTRPRLVTTVLLVSGLVAADVAVRTGAGTTAQQPARQLPSRPRPASRPDAHAASDEEQATQEVERLLGRLRAAPTENEKRRLERAIVEFVRGELRGTWRAGDFILEGVDDSRNTIRVVIAGTTLTVNPLPLAKDASVWIDGRRGRRGELRPGMGVALQLGNNAEPPRVVGIRVRKTPAGPPMAVMDRLIRQLGSAKFAERQAASKALKDLGRVAAPALRQAATSADAEVRGRARRLLEMLERPEGRWYLSPVVSQECSIREATGKLCLINEHGDQSEGIVVLGRTQIEVVAWGGMRGKLEIDKAITRISWPNGTVWIQKRP
jgi:hypothetical protein